MIEYSGKVVRIKSKADIMTPLIMPIGSASFKKADRLKTNETVIVSIKQVRTHNLLNNLWAVSNFVYDNLETDCKTLDIFRKCMTINVGGVHIGKIKDDVYQLPISWGFITDKTEFMDKIYNPLMKEFGILMDMSFEKLIQSSIDYAGFNHDVDKK